MCNESRGDLARAQGGGCSASLACCKYATQRATTQISTQVFGLQYAESDMLRLTPTAGGPRAGAARAASTLMGADAVPVRCGVCGSGLGRAHTARNRGPTTKKRERNPFGLLLALDAD